MPLKQKTIKVSGTLSGVGLHTGKPVRVTLKPLPEDSGVQFFSDGHLLQPVSDFLEVGLSKESQRCSSVTDGERSIMTVEHLMAALSALGISNVAIEVEGPEIPALDGSAKPFVQWIRTLGIVDQKKDAFYFRIQEPIFCGEKLKAIAIYPIEEGAEEKFSVNYVLDYPHPFLSDQKAEFCITPDIFEKDIAPARTFITEEEALEVQKRRLGLGGGPENTIIIRRDGAHQLGLRFADECVRHKILDIVGDLSLVGFPIVGRVMGLRSGHALNRRLVTEIKKQRELYG